MIEISPERIFQNTIKTIKTCLHGNLKLVYAGLRINLNKDKSVSLVFSLGGGMPHPGVIFTLDSD